MKRSVTIVTTLLFCLLLLVAPTASAQTYHPDETDLNIRVDDSVWYVFTRENIQNNEELEQLGLSYDAMHKILYDNNAYMDAILLYEDGEYVEFFIRKSTSDADMANLSDQSKETVLDLAKTLAEKQNCTEYSAYQNQYSFAQLEYQDVTLGYHILEFATIVNQEGYTFTFQSTSPLSDEERAEIKSIMDSIRFDADPTIKTKSAPSFWPNVIYKTLIGAAVGGMIGAIVGVITKKRKNKKIGQIPPTDNAE